MKDVIDFLKGKRKEYISLVNADTPENREKINRIVEIRREIKTLRDEEEIIKETLTYPEIKADEEVKNENKEVSL